MSRTYIPTMEFAHTWMKSNSIQEVADAYNITLKQAKQKAARLRSIGLNLKRFPRVKTNWSNIITSFNEQYNEQED